MRIDREAELELIRQELRRYGSLTPEDGRGVLATILPGVFEGHFRLDPLDDGTWVVSGTAGVVDRVQIVGKVSPYALSALAAELLLEARRRYCITFDHPVPPPLPPPSVRARPKGFLAEEVVAAMVGGSLATAGKHGYDVLGPGGRRIQVKASARNPKSGLISTLQFKSSPAYHGHDELIYVEFSPENFPIRAWAIDSDLFRSHVPDDRKTHQVEGLLSQIAADISAPFTRAFVDRFMPDYESA